MNINEQLQRYVERVGLEGVLSILWDVCDRKAAYCRTAWQDNLLAEIWQYNAGLLNDCIEQLT